MPNTLTKKEIKQIQKLRYRDGLTLAITAKLVNRSRTTVRNHAPGRPSSVPVAPLREVFLKSNYSAYELAQRVGWFVRGYPDSSRVLRTLGLRDDISGSNGLRSRRSFVDAETVINLADALGIMPWEVLPDEESDE